MKNAWSWAEEIDGVHMGVMTAIFFVVGMLVAMIIDVGFGGGFLACAIGWVLTPIIPNAAYLLAHQTNAFRSIPSYSYNYSALRTYYELPKSVRRTLPKGTEQAIRAATGIQASKIDHHLDEIRADHDIQLSTQQSSRVGPVIDALESQARDAAIQRKTREEFQ